MAVNVTPKPEPTDPGLPPPNPAQAAADKKARADALKVLEDHRRATAWPIGRWPVERRPVHTRARVHLPRTYLARQGSDVRVVYPGMDLNQFVHMHYFEEVGKDGWRLEDGAGGETKAGQEQGRDANANVNANAKGREAWPNYVAPERICTRRHEFLGPDPRVAGYTIDADGDYHVKWYDTFLQDQWMDNHKWKFDVRLDDRGRWVDVDDP